MATLKQFLQTGELGPIHPGMSQAEVTALLGPPQDESVARHPQILKYGGLQLTFLGQPGSADRSLAHIGLYFGPRAEPIPQPALPADFMGTPETTIAEVREFLTRVGLNVPAAIEYEDTNSLILPSGATITFDAKKLRSINFASPRRTPAKKQISVSVSEDTLNQLRTLARQLNRSVAEVCAEWITQRANELQHENARGVGTGG
jgi:hypothetical protein